MPQDGKPKPKRGFKKQTSNLVVDKKTPPNPEHEKLTPKKVPEKPKNTSMFRRALYRH